MLAPSVARLSVWCVEAVCDRLCAFETADARQTKLNPSPHDLWLSFEPLCAYAVPDGDGW